MNLISFTMNHKIYLSIFTSSSSVGDFLKFVKAGEVAKEFQMAIVSHGDIKMTLLRRGGCVFACACVCLCVFVCLCVSVCVCVCVCV